MQPVEPARQDTANRAPTHSPKVSIVILNWNSYDVTAECLRSLRKVEYPEHEIVLVDNGSQDGSAERLQAEFPEVRVLRNAQNLGFPGGNNVGIRDALERGTDYLLLLNNDTIVSADFLTRLVSVAEAGSAVGLVNPKIYFLEPPDRLWHGGARYRSWWSFPKIVGVGKQDDGSYGDTKEVPFTTGCALLIKSEVLRKVGLLAEEYFLGFEDLDFSLRARRAGYKTIYAGNAAIWHRSAYVTQKNLGKPVKDFYYFRNTVLVARKFMLRRYWPLYLLSLGWQAGYRTAGYLLRLEFRRVAALHRGMWTGFTTPLSGDDQHRQASCSARASS